MEMAVTRRRYVLTREGPTRATRNRATRAGVIEKDERIVVVASCWSARLGVGVRIDQRKQIRKELFFPLLLASSFLFSWPLLLLLVALGEEEEEGKKQ
jgi:hypothetical protein